MHDILDVVNWSKDGTRTVTTKLAEWLQDKLKEKHWSRREAARKTEVSYTALTAIIAGETKVPTLINLDRLSRTFEIPLLRLVELCDQDNGFKTPEDRDLYLAQLVLYQPQYRVAVEGLLSLSPDDFAAAARHIAALKALRQQSGQEGETPQAE